jgi:hypothetical protein
LGIANKNGARVCAVGAQSHSRSTPQDIPSGG